MALYASNREESLVPGARSEDGKACINSLARPFRCTLCSDVFERALQLDYHRRSIHLQEKSQTCDICGKGFFRKSDLQTHLNVHLGTNQFVCELCGRKFNHVSNLIRHSRIHAGCKPYPCTICAKRFSQISSLTRHKRTHGRSYLRYEEETNSGKEICSDSTKAEEKKRIRRRYYCRICGENFRFMVLLRQHKRKHAKNQATSKTCCNNVQQKDKEHFDCNVNSMRQESADNLDSSNVELTGKADFAETESDPSISNMLHFSNSYVSEYFDQDKVKDIDIAQFLNSADFGASFHTTDTNIVNLLEVTDPKSASKRHKFFLVDGQLYIEVQETKALNEENIEKYREFIKLENIENEENCFDSKESKTKDYRINLEENNDINRGKGDKNFSVDKNDQESEIKELRLVRTETDDHFYELILSDRKNDSEEVETVRECQRTKEKNLQSSGENENLLKSIDEVSSVQLIQNYENCVENCDEGPMVRLVQNEDGEQFFELVRESPECEFNENSENNEPSDSMRNDSASFKLEKKEVGTRNGQKISKDPVRKFKCNECEKWFSTAYNFAQHAGMHFADRQKFRCEHCGLSFAWKSTLNKHLASKHRPDGPQKFVCQICPKVYGTLSQVNEHVKRDHLKERKHVCKLCGKSFFKKFDLKTHSRTHTKERPYVCRACGKAFHHQSHIIRHERIHSGEKPYECNICQRTFTQPGSLKSHKLRHRDVKIDILEYRMNEDDPLTLPVV